MTLNSAVLLPALQAALDAVDQAVAVIAAPEWRCTYANAAFASMLPGMDFGKLALGDMFPEASLTQVRALIDEALATRRKVPRKLQCKLSTGLDCTVEVSPVSLQDSNAQSLFILVLAPAATGAPGAMAQESLDHASALREKTALLEAISNSSPDVIFAKDRLGRMTFANPGVLALVGKKLDQVLGRTDLEFLDDRAAAAEVMANDLRIMETGIAEEIEETVPLPDGRKKVWLSRKTPYIDEHGKVIGLLGISRDITDRKAAEEGLRTAHRAMSRILDSITDGLAVMDRDWRYTYFSETGARILGVRREDMIGHRLWDLFPQADEALFGMMYRRAMETGEATHFEEYYPAPLDMWVECHCYPSEDGLSVYFHDVTQRHKADEALSKSEQRAQALARLAQNEQARLRAVLETVPIGIAYVDAQAGIVRTNVAHKDLWGAEQHIIEAGNYRDRKGWWAGDHERKGQPLNQDDWSLARALKGEIVSGELITIERFDDKVHRIILVRAHPIKGTDGRVSGAVAALMDVTEQMRTEAALRESEEKFRTITNALPQMVWTALPDGTIDYHNEQFYQFMGLRPGEAEGKTAWADKLLHPEDKEAGSLRWKESVESGKLYEMTYRVRDRSGEYRWILARALPLRDETGAITKWLGTDTDIHVNKLNEQAMETASRQKDDFLAMLGHELRNPLAPIATAAEMLKMAARDDPKVSRASEVIGRQVRHMAALLDDLLDVSRVTRGFVELRKDTVDLESVIDTAVEQSKPVFKSRAHTLLVKTGVSHPPVIGDRNRLVQVVANLLNNAAKYTPPNGTVVLSVRAESGRVIVEVEDNGIGIDAALLPHIFELFTQAERTPDRSQGGLGIGLALVKTIVGLHGGEIVATSAGLGAGSRFTVTLPLA
jgi:PAS domain S-box-containing protein